MRETMKTERGMSLVELMIVVGIGSVISLSFATMINNQARASKQLGEKVATVDLTREVTSILSDSAKCGAIITTAGNLSSTHFNATALPAYIAVHAIPNTALTAGQPASPALAPELKLLANTGAPAAATNGLVLEITTPTLATLHVRIDNSTTVTPLRELQFPDIQLLTTGPATSTTITGCGALPSIAICLSGCSLPGGPWPTPLGAIAMWNWYSHDNTSYGTRGSHCTGPAAPLNWVYDTVGGGTHAGPPSAGGGSFWICGR